MSSKRYVFLLLVVIFGMILFVLLRLGRPLTPIIFCIMLTGACLGGAAAWYLAGLIHQRKKPIERSPQMTKQVALPWHLNQLFIFNTLHNISALTLLDGEKARSTIEQLAELIRSVNELCKNETTLLTREVHCAELLLAIETARLGDRLQVSKEIAAECMEATLPSLILLPLVESAIRHSVEMSEEPVQITLRAYYRENSLLIEVSESGHAGTKSQDDSPGTDDATLERLHSRLQFHYGNRYALKTFRLSPSGTMTRLQLSPR